MWFGVNYFAPLTDRKCPSEQIHFRSAASDFRLIRATTDGELILTEWNTNFFYFYSADSVDQTVMSSREALNMKLPPIQSTAGAVPIRNEKGET